MIVVADTSVLIAFSKMNRLEILTVLFKSVMIPESVVQEFEEKLSIDEKTIRSREGYLIENPTFSVPYEGLDLGESDAIRLALDRDADRILIDERRGRRFALTMGLDVTGTVGVLEIAARLGLVDLRMAFHSLISIGFRYPPNVLLKRLEDFESGASDSPNEK